MAYVLCVIKSGDEDATLEKLSSFDKIKEYFMVYGEYDIIFKVVVKSPDELREFLTKSVRGIPSIERTTTLIAV
ncbi:MAG TPA: Lrp/AsnC ligand binding domain-containing protein [Candidatus Methanofastidiosa archaeon]|nr:Lrp/AsnC ligand binding domain-containing protein [Candidatus Methanofastidiosa archaeon]